MTRALFIFGFLLLMWIYPLTIHSQCGSAINTFPYRERFEINDGGWMPGGTGSDWAWGSPAKTIIAGAGEGSKCWITGGLTPAPYTSSEASWLQSPCFDFSTLQYPYIELKVNWDTELQFDGGSLQYSVDNGVTWAQVGTSSDPAHCLNANWFNYSPITYLAPLGSTREGWSGTNQAAAGSCRVGNGSNGWVTAKHTMPFLAGRSSVIFRFVFGAGTICNNYDGFAIDDIQISEAHSNAAAFSFVCTNATTVVFTDNSAPCPAGYSWDFGDPGSGASNTSTQKNPTHVFPGPGTYTVKLTVTGPDNAPSTINRDVTIIALATSVLSPADCNTGTGGSAMVTVTGGAGPFLYNWNTLPPQTSPTAIGLSSQVYSVTVNGASACPATASISIPLDLSCAGIYFPSAFTPNNDNRNDGFGAIGSLASLTHYQLRVYNRWGEIVFTTKDPFKKWDGRFKGMRSDGNVFVWQASYEILGSGTRTQKGIVMLIR